jgi:riboflavin synthase
MFTGIIETVGKVAQLQPRNGDLRLRIDTGKLPLGDVALGDSIATETLAFTTIGDWRLGAPVNLEKALQAQSRLGGHIVSGHVDGVGEVIDRGDDARSIRLTVRAPRELARYIAHKGSICVDGTSLTVNAVRGTDFELNIIPHTAQITVIGNYRAGTRVNLEVDVIARYLERLLQGDAAADTPAAGGISAAFLAEHGYGPRS